MLGRSSISSAGVAAVTSALPAALAGESAAIRRARAALEAWGAGPLLLVVDEGLEPHGIARFLHDRARPDAPFVAVNCAQGDAGRLERLLLGGPGRPGRDLERLGSGAALAAARGGTLFLEYAGELPAVVQKRLARLLRDDEALMDGRGRVPLDMRLVASAAPTIAADAKDGRFRQDLLRRFGGAVVNVPSLHARRDDLPAVIAAVARELAIERHLPEAPGFTQPALTVLSSHRWGGNVAELRAVIARVFDSVAGPLVRQEDVLRTVTVEGLVAGIAPIVSLREARRRFEREYIAAVLERHEWRMRDAARTLGMERANLYRKARQLGISRAAKTAPPASAHRHVTK